MNVVLIALLVSQLSLSKPPVRPWEAGFASKSYSYTGGKYKDKTFRYSVLVPDKLDENDEYPLILWLHGYGDGEAVQGDSNGYLLHTRLLFSDTETSSERFFVLLLQCPTDSRHWFTGRGDPKERFIDRKGDEPLTVLMEVVDTTIEKHPIDRDRISILGISSGGNGAWELAMRYPDRFAALVPCGSGSGDISRVKKICHLPTWAFHSTDDAGTPIIGVERTVDALRAAGGCVELTLIESHLHDCWTAAFEDYDVVSWMIAQRRGQPEVIAPTTRFKREFGLWTWTQIFQQVTVLTGVAGVFVLWRWERHKKLKSRSVQTCSYDFRRRTSIL